MTFVREALSALAITAAFVALGSAAYWLGRAVG
jgi:hypothetical protein